MRPLMRRLGAVLGVALALALVYAGVNALERGVDLLIARVGAGPTLAVVALATVALAALWVRYGGARVLRRWGVMLAPPADAKKTARRN